MYMAPELHCSAYKSCVAGLTDIFSMGVLFFMIAFGVPPFHEAVQSDSYFTYLRLKAGSTDFFKHHPHTKNLYLQNKIPESI